MIRENWINLRGLSVIGVLLIHSSAVLIDSGGFLGNIMILINQLSRFSVPVFFISSGYGLTLKNNNINNYRYLIQSKISYLLFLYLIWSLIYSFLSNERSISDLLVNIFTVSSQAQLYFLVVLIAFYLIFPFLIKLMRNNFFSRFIMLVCFSFLFIIYVDSLNFMEFRSNPLLWLIFFISGIHLAQTQETLNYMLKNSKFLLILGLLLLVAEVFIGKEYMRRVGVFSLSSTRPIIFFYTICVIGYFLNFFNSPNKFLSIFDKFSLDIFLSHFIFLVATNKFLEFLNFPDTIFKFLILLFSTAFFSLIFCLVKKKLLLIVHYKINHWKGNN